MMAVVTMMAMPMVALEVVTMAVVKMVEINLLSLFPNASHSAAMVEMELLVEMERTVEMDLMEEAKNLLYLFLNVSHFVTIQTFQNLLIVNVVINNENYSIEL